MWSPGTPFCWGTPPPTKQVSHQRFSGGKPSNTSSIREVCRIDRKFREKWNGYVFLYSINLFLEGLLLMVVIDTYSN